MPDDVFLFLMVEKKKFETTLLYFEHVSVMMSCATALVSVEVMRSTFQNLPGHAINSHCNVESWLELQGCILKTDVIGVLLDQGQLNLFSAEKCCPFTTVVFCSMPSI